MTAGQKLVELSGLPSGSALAHLLAITQGTGTGRTVFASQITVCMSAPSATVVQREYGITSTSTQPSLTTEKDKPARCDIRSTPARIDVAVRPSEMYVVQRTIQSQFVQTRPKEVTARRNRTISSI